MRSCIASVYAQLQCTLLVGTCYPEEQSSFRVTPNATHMLKPGYGKLLNVYYGSL